MKEKNKNKEKEKAKAANFIEKICENLGIVKPVEVLRVCQLASAFEVEVQERGFQEGFEKGFEEGFKKGQEQAEKGEKS